VALALMLVLGGISLAHADILEQGKAQLAQDNYEEAYGLFVRAIEATPGSVDAHYHAGVAAQAIPDLKKAKQHYSEALKRHAGHSEARAGLAEVHYALGERAQAKALIEQSAKEGPLSDRLRYLKATMLVDDGKTGQALAEFRQLRASSTYSQRAGYQAGLIESGQGDSDAARKTWEEALALEPRSTTADAIRYALPMLKAPTKGLSATVAYRFEHDSNVAIGPSTSVPGLASEQADNRHVFNFDLIGQSLLGGQTLFRGEYHFYQNSHNDLGQFNQQAHEARLGLSFPIGGMSLQLPYTFNVYNVDGDRYLTSHTIAPALSIPLAAKGQTLRPFMKFQSNNYQASLLADENRDSSVVAGGLGYLVSFSGKGSVGFSYEHGEEDADGANWDNKYDRVEARLHAPLGDKLMFRGIVEFVRNDFDNVHSLFLAKRKDDAYTFTLGLAYPFLKQAAILADAAFNKHDSTLAAYAYDRDVYSLGLSWRF
jgi:Tfp pilus assembly protein PilF